MSAIAEKPMQEILTDAVRFWEPRRIPYNVVLALITLGWLVFTWPHFRAALTFLSLLRLFILAVLANVCYSAAYVAEVTMQHSAFRDTWRRRRWILWLIGMLMAAALTYYWIGDEIYPSVAP